MTKREKAVIDKIIDKIITSEVLVKGTDYNFSSAVLLSMTFIPQLQFITRMTKKMS